MGRKRKSLLTKGQQKKLEKMTKDMLDNKSEAKEYSYE